MTKLNWGKTAKNTNAQKELEKQNRDGESGISGISQWDKRMEGRCTICGKKFKEKEKLELHIYYRHSKEYKKEMRNVRKEISKKGRINIDVENMTDMQKAMFEAQKRANKKMSK